MSKSFHKDEIYQSEIFPDLKIKLNSVFFRIAMNYERRLLKHEFNKDKIRGCIYS